MRWFVIFLLTCLFLVGCEDKQEPDKEIENQAGAAVNTEGVERGTVAVIIDGEVHLVSPETAERLLASTQPSTQPQ